MEKRKEKAAFVVTICEQSVPKAQGVRDSYGIDGHGGAPYCTAQEIKVCIESVPGVDRLSWAITHYSQTIITTDTRSWRR